MLGLTKQYLFLYIILLTCAELPTISKAKYPLMSYPKLIFASLCLFGSLTISISYADTESTSIWALNVGGLELRDLNGAKYMADDCDHNSCQAVDSVVGTHDQQIYNSYREGNLRFSRAVANGQYDISLHFMEPRDIAVGERQFDVLVQGVVYISNMDVRKLRDGRIQSALSRTIPNISVTNGTINLELRGNKGLPVISGFQVQRRSATTESDWELIWSEQFEVDGQPDSNKWSIDIWPAGKVNSEDQTYTARNKNLRIENGLLIIEAHREQFRDAKYTSARIHTRNKVDLQYGKVEVAARLPKGQGTWPAIWMLPSDPYRYATSCSSPDEWQGSHTCDAWPNSGEIDIMEHVGYDPNIIHGTVHTKSNYWLNWNQHKGSIQLRDVDRQFYRYGLEWTPNSITTLVNDIPYFTYHRRADDWKQWPFNHPFHIILNLAIGGDWGRAGGPIDDSAFPTHMAVDYVKIFKPKGPGQ